MTLGIAGDIPVGIYEAAKDLSEHMFDSKEKFADWLTLGTVEMAKGAFNPDEAWSADHWLNSLGMVTLLYGPVEKSLLPTGSGGLKPPKGLDSVKDFEVKKPLPAFSTNEGFQFKINNLDVDTPALPQTPMQINFKNEMDRILREKMEGESDSNHSIKDVEVKAVEGTGKVQTGGKSDIFDPDEYLRNLDKADEMYDTFRSSTTDVASITRNTGMKDSRVQRIKEHLFIKEHIKDHGVGRFDADYDIAQAWERLQKGTYNQSDIDLLNHELFESRFEGIFKTNYRTAHDKTLESGRPWNP